MSRKSTGRQSNLQYKSLTGETADVDKSSRTVVVYFSKFGNKDLDGDIILPGSFTKTIAERGPKGTNEIFHLFNHRADLLNVMGKPKELTEDAYGLKAVTPFLKTPEADRVLEGYDAGVYNQHSIGYSVIKWQRNDQLQAYELLELKLYEGSTVLWGANPETPFLGFSKAKTKEQQKHIEEYVSGLWKSYEETLRIEQRGALNESFKGLADLQLSQLKSLYSELAAQVAVDETQPPLGTEGINPLGDFKAGEYLSNQLQIKLALSQWKA